MTITVDGDWHHYYSEEHGGSFPQDEYVVISDWLEHIVRLDRIGDLRCMIVNRPESRGHYVYIWARAGRLGSLGRLSVYAMPWQDTPDGPASPTVRQLARQLARDRAPSAVMGFWRGDLGSTLFYLSTKPPLEEPA